MNPQRLTRQRHQHDVVAHRHRRDDAFRLAVLGKQPPGRSATSGASRCAPVGRRSSRCRGRGVASRRSPSPSPSAPSPTSRPSRALARPHGQRNVDQLVPSGEPLRRAAPRRAPAGREAREPLGANIGDVPTEHRGDHLELGGLGDQLVRARRPSRRIVMRSEISNTSSRLWLTKSRATPAPQASDHPEHLGHLAARATTSARRGSRRGRRSTRRTMAIICWTPAPNELTGRRTSMSMP